VAGRIKQMITGLHTLVYADDPEAARVFFRDVLELPHVDTGGGWLIFRTGPSELGVHPTSWTDSDGEPGGTSPKHEISLMCDDIEATVADLRAKGAEFTREIRDDGFGFTIDLVVPGGPTMMLYQPKYDPPAFLP
jgi:catechol 2,3-dioxygenase-like lactoylglutathione lyase family enzyme